MHSIGPNIVLQFKMSRNVAATDQACLPLCRSKSAMGSMYFSFENERLQLQLVTMIIRFVRCPISTFGNEHLIRLYVNLKFACKESVIKRLPHNRGTHSNSQQTEEAHC